MVIPPNRTRPQGADLSMSLFKQASTVAASLAAPAPTFAPGLGDDDFLLASQALTTDEVVNLPGMTRPFLAHQGAAYRYAVDRTVPVWGCAFLGDDMGMGKTQVLLALLRKAILDAQG